MVELEVKKKKGGDKEKEIVNLSEIIDVKGWKAIGNKLSQYQIYKIKELLPVEEKKEEVEEPVIEEEEVQEIETEVVVEVPESKVESKEEKPTEKAEEKIVPKKEVTPKKLPKNNGFKPGDTIEIEFLINDF